MKEIERTQQMASPFLSPIEEPQDPATKMAYDMMRQQFGKVLTPVKVFNARMPAEFGQFTSRIGELAQKLTLPLETVFLTD